MTVGFVAIHYPHTAHYDESVSCVRRAIELMRPTPGCVRAECWVTPAGEAVVSISHWESEAAQVSLLAIARATGVDLEYDERKVRRSESLQVRELR